MPRASELKRGAAIEQDGKLLLVKQIDVHSPSARGAATLYKVRFSDIATRTKVEYAFKGDDNVTSVELERHSVSFSYIDGDDYIFMDNESFVQYAFKTIDIEEEILFITEETQGLTLLTADDKQVALELPQSVEMLIEETDPSIKGASASARTKPARFATGLTIQVPEYISTGERVKINTADKKFMGRAD